MSDWSIISGYSGVNEITYRSPNPSVSNVSSGVIQEFTYRSLTSSGYAGGQISGVIKQSAYRMNDSLIRTEIKLLNLYNVILPAGGFYSADGNPLAPCLMMANQSSFRFRWALQTGVNSIRVNVKQPVNLDPRPSIYINANPAIGVVANSGVAISGNGWVLLGPISVTGTGMGGVWVELRNNYEAQLSGAPCFWDHVVFS